MISTHRQPNLSIHRLQQGTSLTIELPSFSEVVDVLDRVSRGSNHSSSRIDCNVQLQDQVDVQLSFVLLHELESGFAIGWIVQLSSFTEPNSFCLVSPSCSYADARRSFVQTQLRRQLCRIDARCIISNAELILWLRNELMPVRRDAHFRWVDALSVLRGSADDTLSRSFLSGMPLSRST